MSDDLERLLRERFLRADLPTAPFSLRLAMQAIAQKPPPPIVRRDRSRVVKLLAVAAVLTAGGLAIVLGGGGLQAETAIQPSTVASSSPTPSASAGPSPRTAAVTGAPPSQPAATSSVVAGGPLVNTAAAPIGLDVMIAPGRDGTVFVAVPASGGTVLTSLDRSGQPRSGWPITLDGAPSCLVVQAVEDGSVRLVCGGPVVGLGMMSHARAFAFDESGKSMPGWPVELPPMSPQGWARYEGRMLDEELIVSIYTELELNFGQVTTISASGEIRPGAAVTFTEAIHAWGVSPDGYAYGVSQGRDSSTQGRLTSIDVIGRRSGWPVDFEGVTSGPAFGPGGEIMLTVGSPLDGTTRLVVFDAGGTAIAASSAELQLVTVLPDDIDCATLTPKRPIVASDGTAFLFSGIAIYALDRSQAVKDGWPYLPTQPLATTGYDDPQAELSCRSQGVPTVGPDGTLYVPLQPRNEGVGGSIVAVGPDAKVLSGWPVELTRAGAEFWSVVVGADGTVYALAIEPEAGGTSSATILAIEPDSTVRYANTIIEP